MNATLSNMATGLLAATEEGEAASNPIIPEWNEVIWGSAAFVILFLVMWKLALPPIRRAMEARTERIQGDLDGAATARSEAEDLRTQYDVRLAEANAEAARIIEEARAAAETVRQERLAAIEPEIAERRAQAEADITAARARAMAEVRADITSIAVGAAEQVVMASIDEAAHARLIENYIERVGN
ncbi:F0F1 ATP synthase subunit B [Candidatus Poriferisodalis sp.]|uniref:F0F1 ATP synthase subunit B n=1 Tax=Candidatus Poriferisodalis sp. TaxID=3101277 RepID=UPI003D0DBB3D